MQAGTAQELKRIALLAGLSFLLGWSIGLILEIFFIATAGYLAWTLRKIISLREWVTDGQKAIPPELDTILGELTYSLSRNQRREARRQKQFRYRLNRYAMMTEALEEGLLVLDRDLSLSWWNPAAAALMGLRSADRGSAMTNLVRDPSFVEFVHLEEFSDVLELPSPYRKEQTLQFSAAKFGGGETVLVVSDISRMRALEGLRREFVANVSHELRTPLTVLRGYIETLSDTLEQPSPIVSRAFEQMSHQVLRMQSLADDLVMLAGLESAEYQRQLGPVQLSPLLDDIVREAELLSRGIHNISLDCDPDVTLLGSRKELFSAFSNLVMNAVRHNPEGATITVSVQCSNTQTAITVADDGVGIDVRHQPRLTERFYRPLPDRGRSTGGTGLGLAIVKHVVQKHGGELSIDSALGQGSRFTLYFPSDD